MVMRVIVSGNRPLADLSPLAVEALVPRLKEVALTCGEVLREGVYFPTSGLIGEFLQVKDQCLYTGMLGKNGAIGIEDLGVPASPFGALVLVSGSAAWISPSAFRDVWARNDAVREMHLRYCQARLRDVRRMAACNAAHLAEARFSNWLLLAQDCLGQDMISLTQQQAADMLGVRRTTVTLWVQELEQAGIIGWGRGKFKILDSAGLEARSCGCSRHN